MGDGSVEFIYDTLNCASSSFLFSSVVAIVHQEGGRRTSARMQMGEKHGFSDRRRACLGVSTGD